jgi:hypothetical protein
VTNRAVRTWRVTRVWRGVAARTAGDAITARGGEHVRTIAERDLDDIESRRRSFMHNEPDLYAYIEARVAARELDRAGGDASGAVDNYGAGNRVWRLSAQWEAKWRAML